jgi:hypothetical protein
MGEALGDEFPPIGGFPSLGTAGTREKYDWGGWGGVIMENIVKPFDICRSVKGIVKPVGIGLSNKGGF